MKALYILLLLSFTTRIYAQSDNCSGATPLSVNAACTNTAYTINEDGLGDPAVNASCFGGTNYSDEWFAIAGTGNNVTVTISGQNTASVCFAVYQGCGGPQVGCNNAISGGAAASFTFLSTNAVTYYLQIQRTTGNNSANAKGNVCLTGIPAAGATNTSCAVPNPICSGSPIVFTANTGGTAASVVNPGNNYSCLFTSPNPSWYYFEIANPGNIAIDITAGSDIDFELWGPYGTLPSAIGQCNAYPAPLDCSYSSSAIEQANANGVTTGQIYVLLVTNYANTVQNITLNTAAGNTATTNCAIVALSVTFGDITAVETDNGALVSWFTYSEHNTGRFDIMHSTNGTEWTKIGSETAALNSSELKNYAFTDTRMSQGNNYYKLIEYDLDNTTYESKTVSLYRDNRGITLYPNPTNGLVNISAQQTITNVEVNDLNGTMVHSTQANDKGVVLNLNQLKKGTYFVNVQTTYNRFVERIVIE